MVLTQLKRRGSLIWSELLSVQATPVSVRIGYVKLTVSGTTV